MGSRWLMMMADDSSNRYVDEDGYPVLFVPQTNPAQSWNVLRKHTSMSIIVTLIMIIMRMSII